MQYVIGRSSRLGNRAINQDRVAALERNNTILLVLGDGLGGKAGGEIASQTLIDIVAEDFMNAKLPVKDPQKFMTSALHRAHFAVIKAGKEHEPPLTPGTTAVLCLIQNGVAWWSHVGDSRLYLFRSGVPIYRTRDHSYVEKLYQSGQISYDKRSSHPMRNYMTRCIGMTDTAPEVTISNEVALHKGDVILLCSDGLWEPVDDMQMGMKLLDGGTLSDSLAKLTEQAEENSYPSSDNISAVAVQIMSLQLIGRAISENIEKQVAQVSNDPLQSAIDVIESTIKLYKDEMK